MAEMKGVVKNLPQGVFNDFYVDMMAVPEQIRKAFVADGWTISFDTEKINAYSNKTGTYNETQSTGQHEEAGLPWG